MKDPLLDKDFLKQLDEQRTREIYAKVIALDFDENPIEEITGRITQGSISVNGTSAVRRTCSMTMVASELNIHNYYWGLNTKFELKVGVKNTIDTINYPEIIWFPEGHYVISTFSTSQSTSSYTISLQGKDKMCMLNGDVGGAITALSVDFGKYDTIAADGTITTDDYLIKDIICEAVHEYAKEPFENIIINDLDDIGIELLESRQKDPFYLLMNLDMDVVNQLFFSSKQTGFYVYDTMQPITDFEDGKFHFDQRISIDMGNSVDPTYIRTKESDTRYSVIKVQYGDVVGYKPTDLTYAGDLILDVGSSVTQMLDKLVSMLGEFEYFYNLDGQFVFQKKKTYVQTSWNNIMNNTTSDVYVENAANTSSATYYFENANIVTSFSNSPDLSNLKNDFSVWGQRTSVSGAEIPVHLRYAIDKKPLYYKTYEGEVFFTDKYYTKLTEEIKSLTTEEDYEKLENYRFKYPTPAGLTQPEKTIQGWTPGWWDIRDWHDYYKLVTGVEPSGTMKWYSRNDKSGCVKKSSLNEYCKAHNFSTFTDDEDYVWLIVIKQTEIDTIHGSGQPNPELLRECQYHESYDNGKGKIITELVKPLIKKKFMYPYASCADTHTFLHFLKENVEKGENVYFYNPRFYFNEHDMGDELIELKKEQLSIDNKDEKYHKVDWREVIYQMSKDYKRHMHDDDFYVKISQNNSKYYPDGYTGYEQYYTDMDGFWRQLYDPFYTGSYKIAYTTKTKYDANPESYYYYVRCEQNTAYVLGRQYYTQSLSGAYVALSILSEATYKKSPKDYYYIHQCKKGENYIPKKQYYQKYDDEYDKKTYWNNGIKESPEALNFWFDFLDSEGELSQYSVKNVGTRPKAENNSDVKAIYFRETPNIIYVDENSVKYTKINITEDMFYEDGAYYYISNGSGGYTLALDWNPNQTYYISSLDSQRALKPGYSFLQIPSQSSNIFKFSSQGKSAKDELDNLLYNYSYCTETISMTTLPIYYLQPNTRIFVRDDNSGICGEYIVSSFTISLTYSGTMSINATKAVENLF